MRSTSYLRGVPTNLLRLYHDSLVLAQLRKPGALPALNYLSLDGIPASAAAKAALERRLHA